MSNKTTLQTNNNKLSTNNTDLANILNTINNLPEAGSGSGGGLSQENATVNLTVYSSNSGNRSYITYMHYNGYMYIPHRDYTSTDTYTATLSVAKGSFIHVITDSNTYNYTNYDTTGGIETIESNSPSSAIIFHVTDSGTIILYIPSLGGGNND